MSELLKNGTGVVICDREKEIEKYGSKFTERDQAKNENRVEGIGVDFLDVEKEIKDKEESNEAENGVTEEKTDGIIPGVESATSTDKEGLDDVDGILKNVFLRKQGHYKPRELEKQDWGPLVGHITEQNEQEEESGHEAIFKLLNTTADTTPRWRDTLLFMLRSDKSEVFVRKTLVFLHSNANAGLKTLSEVGFGGSVCIETNSAPDCLNCSDWMNVMTGLNFDLTSPGSVRDINYVDVSIGKQTAVETLKGFCILMQAMLGLTWTNLQLLLTIEDWEGTHLYNSVDRLVAGCGIEEELRCQLNNIYSKYPSLLTTLGFRRRDEKVNIQWQKPERNGEFHRICLTLHGLFRSMEYLVTTM